ncbi:MAG: hypothetical protein Q9165_006983 [Trypethelium subeluteriae]
MPLLSPTSSSDDEVEKLKVAYFSNEFPRDDLAGLVRRLLIYSKERGHALMDQLISEATWAIKDEIQRMPAELKSSIPPMETILDWVEERELREGLLGSAVDGVLLCVVQLAIYVGFAECHPEDLLALDYVHANSCLTGLGIGLLGAAAVSLSSCLSELPSAGADAARLAFRLGIHVAQVSECLETRDLEASPDSWAYVVHNVTPEDVQREYSVVNMTMPDPAKIFVSAVSKTSVTVSGPPARLTALFKTSEFFRDSRYIPLPVYGGLCHAPHIYGQRDVDAVVNSSLLRSSECYPVMPLYCTSTGQPFTGKDGTELFKQIVLEHMAKPICWDTVIEGVVQRAMSMGAQECNILCFRTSLPVHDLTKALKAEVPALGSSTLDLLQWTTQPGSGTKPRGPKQSKIAIVGMSCRLPGGATDNDKFWQVLEQGLDVSRRIPANRFDIDSHFDPSGKEPNKSGTEYMCAIDDPGLFDAPFFNMSPREAAQTDPMMRLALSTAYEALEQAGFVANRTPSTNLHRIGTYYGQASDDYREVNQGQEVSTYYIPGGCRAFGPGRINYFFKFSGPSYSIDTACSSSLATIQVACSAIWNGDVDMAVAGGTNILTNSDVFAGLYGIGSVVLKKLEDAEADNDNILGVILSAGTNHSAEAVSITHPHAESQSYLYRQVVRQAGINPFDISYVEMHGTGTQAGDKTEIKSITDVFAPSSQPLRSANQPLYIGTVKANMGHGEAVAGVTALIKVLLMLQKNAIPKHVGIKTSLNPEFPKDFEKRNLHIPYEQTPWPHSSVKKRLAVVNNFGAAGGNSTLILEEGSLREVDAAADPCSIHVITTSAKNKTSLRANLERLIAYLETHDVELRDLSYTATARRCHHTSRIAIVSSDLAQLKKQLASRLSSVDSVKSVSAQPPIAFVFTGQGASYKSMNLKLYREAPAFRTQITQLDGLAQAQGFPSFIPALDGSHPQDHLHTPVVTQLALVSTEIALAKYWGTVGIKPDMVMGHSLGEYAAMHVAGVLSASDTIALVGKRARMLEEKCTVGSHIMMAVRAPLDQIRDSLALSNHHYTVACINGPSDTVLSGTEAQINDVGKILEPAEEFEEFAQSAILFREPMLPVISPLLRKVVFDGKTLNANYARRATRETVDFLAALTSAQDIGTVTKDTVWVEMGYHPVCIGIVKSSISTTPVTAVPSMRRGENNWTTLANSLAALHLAGVEVSWNEFHRPFEAGLRLLDLPTYAWNDKNYWIQYNGDWNLTKGNTFYDSKKTEDLTAPRSVSSLSTSLVQQIIEESINQTTGQASVMMQADLMQPEFLAAAHGHRMNGCGVVTSSIHGDIAFTLGEYMYRKFDPKAKSVDINIADLHVSRALVAQNNTNIPQNIRVLARTTDIQIGTVDLLWYNVDANGKHNADDPFATAKIHFGSRIDWHASWLHTTHLVRGRIDELDRLVVKGVATRFSHNMAYTLWASTLVDYAQKYRGMQSVVLHDLEAYADVQLTTEKGGAYTEVLELLSETPGISTDYFLAGRWTVAPFFIDSVAHLAGFIMNCSDYVDTHKNFFVTSGWDSMRFAKPLIAGGCYRSYVKMLPMDSTNFVGDVYILQDDEIMGMVGRIRFRQYPRILMDRFSAPDSGARAEQIPAPTPTATSKPQASGPAAKAPAPALGDLPLKLPQTSPTRTWKSNPEASVPTQTATAPTAVSDSTASKALHVIAKEAALEVADLDDEASFANLGIDSLMSLVIAEKLRRELDVKVTGSLFLDYSTVGDLRGWLEEAYA